MDNEGRLFSQVAAEAGVSAETAMVACYLLNLSRKGKSMDDAAALMRKGRAEVRSYARDWGISFSDYMTSPQPLRLTWVKTKRGRWELSLDGLLIAFAVSDGSGTGSYVAKRETHELVEFGSSAEIAIRRLSEKLEQHSVAIFGLDDVQIFMAFEHGHDLVAPKSDADTGKFRRALAA